MIDIKALEKGDGFAAYLKDFKNRGGNEAELQGIEKLITQRKAAITEFEKVRSEQNKVTQEIAQLKRTGADASKQLEAMKAVSQQIKNLEAQQVDAEEKLKAVALRLPNKLHSSVPVGKSTEDNLEVRKHGDPVKLGFTAKDHADLGEKLGMIDFERAGKIAGARFAILNSSFARMERGLINFMLDIHAKEHGYVETLPPFIVNSASLLGTGQLPKFEADVFRLKDTDYFLIPTAEVPVTNYFRGEILDGEKLTLNFCAYTPCFRSEAGAYGKDTKGLIRQHQFNKVELVKFTRPETSYEEHEKLTQHAEVILKRLELPYKVMSLCSGDIGFGAAKCHDIEVWLPSQNAFREISSCSNFEDFQSRRSEIRFKDKGGKAQFVHTINGSGLAVGRTLVAIVENYQNEDGSIRVPKALQPYMDGLTVIK